MEKLSKSGTRTIFLDLDGVVYNFDSMWQKMFMVDKRIPTDRKTRNERWQKFVDEKCFEKLEMLPDAMHLIESLKEYERKGLICVEILSSAGGKHTIAEVRQQKLRHLKADGIKWKTNIVDQSSHKAEYARPDALLIDDYKTNTDAFVEAGGQAILYSGSVDEKFTKSLLQFIHTTQKDIFTNA
jgi:hypothetical protein